MTITLLCSYTHTHHFASPLLSGSICEDFLGGHPSWYHSCPSLLNYEGRMGSLDHSKHLFYISNKKMYVQTFELLFSVYYDLVLTRSQLESLKSLI